MWNFRWDLPRRSCRYTSNRLVLETDTSGHQGIGLGTTITTIIIGCRERGWKRRNGAICGRRDIGDMKTTVTNSTMGIGDRKSDSMAASTMGTATPAEGMKVDVGKAAIFTTTGQ